jgi:Questin oxidase-like
MTHQLPTPAESMKVPRRRFMRDAALVTTAACLSSSPLLACQGAPSGEAASAINTDAMEQALDRMLGLAPLSNHGPMAAEALVAMGRPDAVADFVEGYKKRFTAGYPSIRQSITRENWRAALGDGQRVADWTEFFNRELKEVAWPRLLEQWVAPLSPGLAAAAAHGLIRTAHAVRSLSIKETDLRRRELAEGLGYWAAYYQTLPTLPASPNAQTAKETQTKKLRPAQAFHQIPLLPDAQRPRAGSIMIGLRSLNDFRLFAGVADLIETTGKPERLLSDVTETFATAYIKNVTRGNLIALIHTVTGATGLRSLLPYLSPATAQKALRYGWQTGAALYSVYGVGSTNGLPESKEIRREDLIERAVDSREEHAIKFTEACLREYALNPKPIYLQAAQDALERINPV